MKKCTKCGLTKALKEFAKNRVKKDGRQNWCRTCKKAYDKEQYQENPVRRSQIVAANKANIARNAAFVNRYLQFKSCERCGEIDFRTFVFHHKDPASKDSTISRFKTNGCSMKRLKAEIRKCEILCANCHSIEHYAY